ncbi:MAG: thiamine ABC transporter substrate-binding protein, partial [Alphaproteobacteria bacterium]|nr:thiamine ABC transporter substrate-binding protein [Alphaproteobacteria bacterium]
CCLAFTYDSQKIPQPPQSLEALINSPHKIILQDPRTSITGFGFLVWMKKAYGENATEKWKTLAAHVLTFTKGWSDSALLFKKGEAPIVLSYTIDGLYHELTEGNPQFKAMVFPEGHLCSQIYAAKVKVTKNGALADKFIDFLLTPEAQNLIVVKGWGYPISGEMPDSWLKAENYLSPPAAIPFTSEEVAASSKGWLQEWIDGLIK